MLKHLLLHSATLLIAAASYGQLTAPPIAWQKCIGGTDVEIIYDIQPTTDGGYISVGYTQSADGGATGYHASSDWLIVRMDQSGNVLWKKAMGGSGADVARAVKQVSDGGFVIAGYTSSNDGDIALYYGSSDAWVVKLDAGGSYLWQRSLGGTGSDVARSIRETVDNALIIAGTTNSTDLMVTDNHGGNDIWVARLDGNGSLQWAKTYGGTGDDRGTDMMVAPDGNGYIISGYSNSADDDLPYNHGGYDAVVIRIDGTGALQQVLGIGGTGDDYFDALDTISDGNIIVGGYSSSNDFNAQGNHGGSDYWAVKLYYSSPNYLDIKWTQLYGGPGDETFSSLITRPDGYFLLAGSAASVTGDVTGNHGQQDAWLVKIDGFGVEKWEKCYGGASYETANAVRITSDGNLIMAGATSSNDGDVSGYNGDGDGWIAKLGTTTATATLANAAGDATIYPNPATTTVSINGAVSSRLAGIDGRVLIPMSYQTNLDISALPTGIYLLDLFDAYGARIKTEKLSKY